MTVIRESQSILAADPTHDGIAFVYLEGGRPLDWGTRRNDGHELTVFDRLLDDYAPGVVVLEDATAPGCERRARMRHLLKRFAARAEMRGIRVVKVSRGAVRASWRSMGVTRKQAAAVRIAEQFADLLPFVPRPRKHSREVPRERLFGLIALVLHAFGAGDVPDQVSRGLRACGSARLTLH